MNYSSIANAIVNEYKCKESSKLNSCTDDILIVSGLWFGAKESVTVVDTPGFLDSENRDADFLDEIISFLKDFPKDKLGVLVITLPLTELRAKATYMQMIDQIELLFGGNIWENTIFVTTQENQLNLSKEKLDIKKAEWQGWIKNKCGISHPKICNFLYGHPQSLDTVRSLHKTCKPTTPETSAKINNFLAGKPFATVNEVIENVNTLKSMQVTWEENLKAAIAEKERYKALEIAASTNNARLQSKLSANEKEISELKAKLSAPVPVREIHHHHHHCCFPETALVYKEGEENPVSITSIKEQDRLLSVNSDNQLVYSEVYFAYGKEVHGSFTEIFYFTDEGQVCI